ncbi:MAG: cytochrome P450 [Solirubrobacterales bacterium]|nr:cytochrome P450 [Solirubrobacterales bacterium]
MPAPDHDRGCPLGAAVTLAQLDADPHPVHARLRAAEPVSWLPVLGGWLVTRHDLALAAMRDPGTFTVDDPRFSTAQVIGPSMLSLDGERHEHHRAPFAGPFRPAAVRARFGDVAAAEAARLVDALAPEGRGELRRSFAGPMAAVIVTRALGLAADEAADVLRWYDAIVASVTSITAGAAATESGGRAFADLRARLQTVIGGSDEASLLAAAAADTALTDDEIASNAAVLLFGGIETTEGMIANALLMLLRERGAWAAVRDDPAGLDDAIDESLRLEPAAAVIDRYATRDTVLGDAEIVGGELVRLSLAAANRDPAVFPRPDVFEPGRGRRGNLAFAQGPHVCVGVHLARLEARAALAELIARLPRLRLHPDRPAAVRGLVFRKPPRLHAIWS